MKDFINDFEFDNYISIDIETTGLDPQKDDVCYITVKSSTRNGEKYRIISPDEDTLMAELKAVCSNSSVKIFHNAVFDMSFLRYHGFKFNNVWCTKIAEKILYPDEKSSLLNVVNKYFGITLDKTLQTSNWGEELTKEQMTYMYNDVRFLEDIKTIQFLEIKKRHLAYKINCAMSYLPIMAEMKRDGIKPSIYEY